MVTERRAIAADSTTIRPGAAAGVKAALYRLHSTCIQMSGDSTGDATDEWFSLLGQRIVARNPAFNLLWRKWNDTAQRYDTPETLVAGAEGASRVTFASGQLTYAAATITGDIDVRVRARPTSWTGAGTTQTFAAKWLAQANGRSWLFRLSTSGNLTFAWSTDGAATSVTATSTAAVPFSNGSDGWVRATLDVDNGASGNTVTFYTSTDGTTWTQLGSPVVTAGVTSIFNSTASYMAGSFASPVQNTLVGDLYWVEICDGIGGPTIVPPLLNYWEQATSPDTDTILFQGSPSLLLLCGAQSGQNITYFDNSTRRPKVFAPHGQQLVMLSTGHNEGDVTGQDWFSRYSTWITNIKTLLPYTPLLLLSQNPTLTPVTTGRRSMRARRGSHAMSLAAATSGVYGLDTYPAFTAPASQVHADGVHPVAAGSAAWAQYVDRALF